MGLPKLMRLKKRTLLFVLIFAATFLYIYNPIITILFVQPIYWVYVFALFILSKNINSYLYLFKKKGIVILVSILLCLFAYSLIFTFASGQAFKGGGYPAKWIEVSFDLLVVAPAFYIILRKYKIGLNGLINILLAVGTIQALFAIVMFIDGDLRNYIMFNVLSYEPGSSKIVTEPYFRFRGFGIATAYLFSYPIFQALCIILSFYKIQLNNAKRYYVIVLLLTFSIIVNARIALLVYPVCLLVYLVQNYKQNRLLIKGLVYSSFLLIFGLYFYYPIRNYLIETNETMSWVITGIELSLGLIESNQASTIEILMSSEHLHFPSAYSTVFFGSGDYIFDNPLSSTKSSDIGYIRYIYYGGVFILSLAIFYYYRLLRFLKEGGGKLEKFLYWSCLLLLLGCHIKGIQKIIPC